MSSLNTKKGGAEIQNKGSEKNKNHLPKWGTPERPEKKFKLRMYRINQRREGERLFLAEMGKNLECKEPKGGWWGWTLGSQ